MTFTEFLQLRVTESREDGVTVECPLQPHFFNPDGSLHGGLIATFADEAVWYALEHVTGATRNSTTRTFGSTSAFPKATRCGFATFFAFALPAPSCTAE